MQVGMTLLGAFLGWNIFINMRILIESIRILRMDWDPKKLRECLPGIYGIIWVLFDAMGVTFALWLAFKIGWG